MIPRGIAYLFYSSYTNILDLIYTLPKPALLKYKILSFILETVYDISILLFDRDKLKKTGALTYGSTPIHTALAILKKVVTEDTKTFLDLGCGRGNFVFTSALGFNLKSTGIELIDTHITFTNLLKTIFRKFPITIKKGDFIKESIPQNDIIFVSNTCFPPFMEMLLTQKLEAMTKGTVIISLSAPLKSENIEIFDQKEYLFSWGKGTVYFQRTK